MMDPTAQTSPIAVIDSHSHKRFWHFILVILIAYIRDGYTQNRVADVPRIYIHPGYCEFDPNTKATRPITARYAEFRLS